MVIPSIEYQSYMANVDSTNGHCHRLLVSSRRTMTMTTRRGEVTSCPCTGDLYPNWPVVSLRTWRMPPVPRAEPPASEGIVAVNNVGRDDAKIDLLITHEHLERLCKASVVD